MIFRCKKKVGIQHNFFYIYSSNIIINQKLLLNIYIYIYKTKKKKILWKGSERGREEWEESGKWKKNGE